MSDIQRITTLPNLPLRPADAHKGTFGSVLVVAGSEGMSGAASLAARAALHGGAGLVTAAIPRCIATIVAQAHPSYMTVPLPDVDGCLDERADAAIQEALPRQSAVAIGPGLGMSTGVSTVVRSLYINVDAPLVLDADGLNVFASQSDELTKRINNAPRVLTPHPGEFARLTGNDKQTLRSNREELAVEFARRHNVVLLLKGQRTVITDGNHITINTTGNSGMATGGSGDVLTGLVASLIAQGMMGFDAAQLGAHVHGLAGDIAAEKLSGRFVTSLELLMHLADAWRELETKAVATGTREGKVETR